MNKRRDKGDGGIDQRGPDTWRLRYRINGQPHTVTVRGSRTEAKAALRAKLKSGDDNTHVPPDRVTFAQWAEQWLNSGAPGRRRKRVGARSLERYRQLLNTHVLPVLGARPLQQIQATEIDKFYHELENKIAPQTQRHVHTVFSAALSTAVRKGMLAASPMLRIERVPSAGESDHGIALEAEDLQALVTGFKGSPLFPIVAVLAFTGARRNEALALRWSDLDTAARTLRIERAIEQVGRQPLTLKGPKRDSHKRTITIDSGLIDILAAEREKWLRIKAGISGDATVDLTLIKLPADALMFPAPPAKGEKLSFAKLRDPRAVTRTFKRRARKLGFPGLRLHDLRGSHETILLDNNVPLKTVADRCGHDAATLLRNYAKRSKKGDTSAADVIGALSKGVLG